MYQYIGYMYHALKRLTESLMGCSIRENKGVHLFKRRYNTSTSIIKFWRRYMRVLSLFDGVSVCLYQNISIY